jgi:hypothetical protein
MSASNGSVCINGRNVVMRSNAFWHFAQGHMLETFALLHARALYAPSLRLSFGDKAFFRTWKPFLRFYLALFDEVPTLDPGCKHATGRVLEFPPFGMGPSSKGQFRAFREWAHNTSLVRACEALPAMHAIAAARRGARPPGARPMRIVLLRRPNSSAASGPGRRILNSAALAHRLSTFAAERNATLFHGNIDSWSPLEQVDLLLETDVLLSYHGSGVGSGHFWMRPGSLVVEFEPPTVPYCVFAVCGHASGKAWIESGDARTPEMEVWKPGGWNSKYYICNPNLPGHECHRRVDILPAMRVLGDVLAESRRTQESNLVPAFERFVQQSCGRKDVHGCKRACGKRVLQVWEAAKQCEPTAGASRTAAGRRNGKVCSLAPPPGGGER